VWNDICSHVTKAETAGAQWLYPASRSTALGFGQWCFSDFTTPTRWFVVSHDISITPVVYFLLWSAMWGWRVFSNSRVFSSSRKSAFCKNLSWPSHSNLNSFPPQSPSWCLALQKHLWCISYCDRWSAKWCVAMPLVQSSAVIGNIHLST
jgi:hypothetical protein